MFFQVELERFAREKKKVVILGKYERLMTCGIDVTHRESRALSTSQKNIGSNT
jgi:hypothetical protein